MKRNRHAQRFRQRQRKRSAGAIERLESRFALAGANQVLRIDGDVTISGGASEMPLHLPSEIFSAGGGAVSLGFHVRGLDTSTLDPAHVVIRRGDHSLVSPAMAADDVGETADSLAIASIRPGDYTLAVTGEEGTIGAFTVEAFLVGDVNSDRTVDRADVAAMVAAYGADAASEAYLTAADADLDGTVSLADLARLQGNLGGALELHPLFVYARIDPEPVELANGSLVSTTADFFVMGVSQPGATIRIDADRDGAFDDGSAVAGEDGAYSIAMSLPDGSYAVAVRGSDAVGQLADSTIDVVVDATDPSAPVVHLHPDSETGAIDDRTTHRFVSLVGTTEPGAIVSLEGSELSTVAAADGTFRLDSVPLAIGANHLYIRARDVAGRQVIHVSPITRIESAETDGPRLNWGLVWDTGEGLGASDRVTSFGGVYVAMVELSSVVHLSLGGANGTNLAPILDEFNNLVLSREELEFHLGRPLAQGMNTMMLTAVDEWGNESQSPLSFLFDTTAPYPPEYTLDPAYDTGAPGDRETDLGLVRIEGYTDSNLRLRLDEYDRWTTSDASGYFAFDDVPLRFAVNFPAVHVFDETGNTVRWDGEFYRPIPDVDVAAPDVSAWLANAPGADGELSTTNAPIVRGVAFDLTDVVRLDGRFADAATADVTNLLGDMDAGGHFVLDGSRLEAIYGAPLVDGEYEFFVQAEDSLGHVQEYSFAFQVDRSGPSISAETLTDGGVVRPGFRLRGSASTDDAPLVAVEYQWENRPALAIGFNPGTGSFEGDLILTGLVPGPQMLTLRAIDAAGNQSSQTYRVTVSAEKLYDLFVYQTSPLDGTLGANIHEPVRVDFSQPVDPTTLTAMSFYAKHNGVKLPATIVTSNDRMSAWLDFDAPLPADADIEVTLEGNRIRTPQFKQLSTDNDLPNFEVFGFHTLSTNTGGDGVLSGRIVGPGPDRIPRTADDFSAGIDGIAGTDDDEYFWPIEGASVYFVGREFDATFTDSEGRFVQEDAPAGAGQVVVDATTIPAHYGYFPRLTVPVWIEPGQESPLVADGDVAYIADVSNGHWTFFDATQPARMPLVADSAYNVASEDQRWMWLDIPANGVMDASGAPVTEAWSGISVLPPDVVRQVLPEGPLQEAFGFLIENDLFARFSAAPSLSLPNVFAQAPGTRQMVLGQDRMTGEFAAIGTAAVSADGTHLTSDAGLNLFEPGMFVLAPPGMYLGTPLARDDGEVIPEPDRISSDSLFPFPGIGFSPEMGPQPAASGGTPNRPEFCRHTGDGIAPPGGAPKVSGGFGIKQSVRYANNLLSNLLPDKGGPLDHVFFADGDSVEWQFNAAPKAKTHAYQECYDFQPLTIKIEFDTKAHNEFLSSNMTSGMTFQLGLNNPTKQITIKVKDLKDKLKDAHHDKLFGVKIKISTKRYDESTFRASQEIELFRLLDSQDKEHQDGKISMPRTAPFKTQERKIDIKLAPGMTPPVAKLEGENPGYFKINMTGTTGSFVFHPIGDQFSDNMDGTGATARIRFQRAAGGFFKEEMKIEGDARGQLVRLDTAKLHATAISVADTIPGLSAAMKTYLKSQEFISATVSRATTLLAPSNGAIKLQMGACTEAFGGICVNQWETHGERHRESITRGDGVLGASIDVLPEQDRISDSEIEKILDDFGHKNRGQIAYELSQQVNRRYSGLVDIYLDNHLLTAEGTLESFATPAQIVLSFAKTIVHEVGHHLSLRHTSSQIRKVFVKIPTEDAVNPTDMMGQNFDREGHQTFKITKGLMKMAVGSGWSDTDFENARKYLLFMLGRELKTWDWADAKFGSEHGDLDVVPRPFPLGAFPVFVDPEATDDEGLFVLDALDFGTVAGAGNGATIASRTYHLSNVGDQPLTVSELTVLGDDFTVTPITTPLNLAPGEFVPVVVSLAPNRTGSVSATLVVNGSAAGATTSLSLTGEVISPVGDVRFDVPNNNLGGGTINEAAVPQAAFATIRNVGLAPLSITSINVLGGDGQFAVVRLPASFSEGIPIVVAPGESFSLDVVFDAKAIGLQNARLVMTTNDADTPQMSVTLVGTGLADDGEALSRFRNYVGIMASDETGTAEYHLRTNGAGHWNTFLRPNSEYAVTLFDAASGLVYRDVGTTGVSGLPQFAGDEPQFDASVEPDSDGDGLADDIEFALGTKSDETDSDGDGVSDFDEFEFGVAPPEAPQPEPLAPLVYNSNNFAVSATVVDGPSASDPTYGYVGAFRGGLAVYDATNAASPSLLGAVPITGFVIGVDADPGTQTLGVAGETGLHLLDLANPARPTLLRSISVGFGGAQFVELYDGAAYVTAGNDVVGYTLKKIDLATGDITQSIPLNTPGTSQNVTGFVRDGEFLYTMNRLSNVLRIFDISGPSVVARGSLVLNGGSGGLAVRNGVAYVGNTFRLDNIFATAWGYSTVNVSDPNNPTPIAALTDAPHPQVPGNSIVVSDSGVALFGGTIGTTFTGLKVVNVSNPLVSTVTGTIARTHAPQIMGLGDGRALVPSLQLGLAMVDFVAADAPATPPAVLLSTDAVDVNPTKPGVQVYEGTTVRIIATSNDNLLTRNVDVLANGVAIARDVTPAFDEFVAVAPRVGPSGASWTLQGRASDRAGNVGLSPVTTLEIVPVAPRIVTAFPLPGEATTRIVESLSLTFSEAMDTALFSVGDYALTAAGGDETFGTADDQTIDIASVEPATDGRGVRLVLNGPLAPGNYRVTVNDEWIRDPMGNRLDGEAAATLPSGNGSAGGDYVHSFTVLAAPTMPPSQFAGEVFPLYPIEPRFIDNYTKPSGPLVSIDATGDGVADAVQIVSQVLLVAGGVGTVETAAAFLSVVPGTGGGGFAAPVLSPVINHASQLALADVDRDGFVDAVVGGTLPIGDDNPVMRAQVLIYFGRPGGTFSTGTLLADVENVLSLDGLAIADLNRDARLDVAMLARGPSYTFVADLVGDGFGEFTVRNVDVLDPNRGDARLWSADINGDGITDLVTDRRLLTNDGTSYTNVLPVAQGQAIRGVADFTSDGKPDLLVERVDGSTGRFLVRVLERTSDDTWTSHPELDIGSSIVGGTYAIGDLTGDGRADFAVASSGPPFSGGSLIQVSSAGGTLSEISRRVIGVVPQSLATASRASGATRDLLASVHYGGIADAAGVALFAGKSGGPVETPIASGPTLENVAVGDFNGDARLDRIGYDAQVPARALLLELGNGDGTFGNPVTISSWSANFEPHAPLATDMNGDGKLDIVAAAGASGIGIYYFRGRGDGTFDPATVLFLGSVDGYSVADMNLDARPDAVFRSSYRLQNADGTFAPPVGLSIPSSITGTVAWTAADVTGDGRPDIVAATATTVAVLVNQPGLTFTPSETTDVLGTASPRQLEPGDVNGDGRADLIVLKFNEQAPQLWLANADGTFRDGGSFAAIGSASAARIADLNGDARNDVVFSTGFGVEVLLGNGDGTFQPGKHRLLARRSIRIAVGDVDGDGLLDLLAGNAVHRRR